MRNEFTAIREPATEGGYWAHCPEVAGANGQGETLQEVRQSLAEAVEAGTGLKKIVLIAGTKSHGPGDHEYEKGLKLLKHCLDTSPNVKGLRTEVHTNGWPQNPATLNDADTIVILSNGADRREQDHPLMVSNRLDVLDRQARRGCGVVMIHWTVFAPTNRAGEKFLEWTGGFFDYQSGADHPQHWLEPV